MTDLVALRRAARLLAARHLDAVLRGLGAALDRVAPRGADPVAVPVLRDPPRGRRPGA